MSSEFTQRALEVFRAAIERPDAERSAFLDTACGGDATLRAKVETMLRFDSDDDEVPQPMRAALSDIAQQTEIDITASTRFPPEIGGYRVTRLIARGGMGDVYEGRQMNPERRVAIKVARTAGATGETARRFELEAQLLARLSHPRIAQIIEAGTTSTDAGSQPFFVMEFVEGVSLKDYATTHLHDTRSKLELMVALCDAVGFAHGQGVIHRDLKPDNVLIDADAKPKVLDFGVAKVESAGGFGAATLRTEAGRIIGTLGYMAPEQLAGTTEGLGPQADVYSLGVMVYELLSGRLPHELDAVTLTRALAVVTTTDAPLLGVIRPEYRGDIEAVVAKALEKDPRHRYADATALQQDLERFLRGEPTLARPAGPMRRFTKWTRRNPALATAVFGVFVLLASTAVILLVKNQEVQVKNVEVQTALAKAQTALDDYNRLEDARRLEQARIKADEPWPTWSQETGLRDWLATYGRLAEKVSEHRAAVERLSAQADDFASDQARWQYTELVKLVHDLDAFADEGGLLAEMKRRHELAKSIGLTTRTDRSADWGAVADRMSANAKYEGLHIKPQVGLIPLGPDPDSGLEEFLHLETHTGELPVRDPETQRLTNTANTGLVFVLLPGGSFWMGADATAEVSVGDMPNSDPRAIEGWEESRRVEDLEPFFMSKFEMTRGQWHYFVGRNRNVMPGVPYTPLAEVRWPRKPVANVSFEDCSEVMRRLGLLLPSEERWEYATRAGSKQAFWTGSDPASLAGHENLFDLTASDYVPLWYAKKEHIEPAPFYDEQKLLRGAAGERGPADVGSYKANAFGLFDVAGNLSEICVPRNAKPDGDWAMARGGNFRYGLEAARTAARKDVPRGSGLPIIGVRPAMDIQ